MDDVMEKETRKNKAPCDKRLKGSSELLVRYTLLVAFPRNLSLGSTHLHNL